MNEPLFPTDWLKVDVELEEEELVVDDESNARLERVAELYGELLEEDV